jgi:hypothetical protein
MASTAGRIVSSETGSRVITNDTRSVGIWGSMAYEIGVHQFIETLWGAGNYAENLGNLIKISRIGTTLSYLENPADRKLVSDLS